ncbi:MAG: DEAD/DEAH box helicase [Acidimicrobiaceae bacterium]|nr:DEAD/DEAH box helicase [Acidimicrobiaceae bacterium]
MMALFAELGYEVINARSEQVGPGGTLGRDSRHEAVLVHRLRDALTALNPTVPEHIRALALDELRRDRSAMLPVRANQEIHELIRDGFRTTWADDGGDEQVAVVHYVDLHDSQKNDWLAVNQFTIDGEAASRRADAVVFVNGIPLVLLEFKHLNTSMKQGYDVNVVGMRADVPQLFWPNGFIIVGNGLQAKAGATYAPWKFFGDWKYLDADKNTAETPLATAVRGTCTKDRLLDLIDNFTSFIDEPGGQIKVVARNHQFIGVNDAIERFHVARSNRDRRLGVFWHTQGSGKSLSMLWFTQKIHRRTHGKWTFVMVTDRTDLEEQLSKGFSRAGAVGDGEAARADSAAHLRALLAADHRYVFTLIQKFRLDSAAREAAMPVLSERDNVIVITDEAHRSQYDTLALNMRQALPNASFMGFTGTPLLEDGEERTREVFGDYVSIYNFQDAIADGATVPLYYENRTPLLRLDSDFAPELADLLDDADLDDDAERGLYRKFGTELGLLARPKRLQRVSRDLVRHVVNRGFDGKVMHVSATKEIAVRMYALVQADWAEYMAELEAEHAGASEQDRGWLRGRIEWMLSTEMAVVISEDGNERSFFEGQGLDIAPHRDLMNREALDERFKDAGDPLRIVFVVGMWMTGFDAPSVSTVYLDRPMHGHTLMQAIARANRVFPGKDNGLIVSYVPVFENLERAFALYADSDADVDSLIVDKAQLVVELDAALVEVEGLLASLGVDLAEIWSDPARQVERMGNAIEAILSDPERRAEFRESTAFVRRVFKAVLPDVSAGAYRVRVRRIRDLADAVAMVTRGDGPDIGDMADQIDDLLDRSVGTEEYVIRVSGGDVADGGGGVIDLSQLDFDELVERFGNRRNTEAARMAALLRRRAATAAAVNPTRREFVERIEQIIADYNAGSMNLLEYLRRLVDFRDDLSVEERRAVDEGLDERELAVLDLLTKPEPELTKAELSEVKAAARELLEKLHDLFVLDWRKKADATARIRETISGVLDPRLPDVYNPALFDQKVASIYDYIYRQPTAELSVETGQL